MVKLERGRRAGLGINGEAEERKTERWGAVDGELSKTRKDLKNKTTKLDKDHLIWIVSVPNGNL